MKITEIESSENQKLKLIRALVQSNKKKTDQDLILLEGQKLIEEAQTKKVQLVDVVVSQQYYQRNFLKSNLAKNLDSITLVKDNIFKGLHTTDTSCGIIATAIPQYSSLDEIIAKAKTIILADDIQDPGNLGTIVRTAFAFDCGGLVLSKGCADCYSPKAIRSSMGAVFGLPIVDDSDLQLVIATLKERHFYVVALEAGAKQTIWQDSLSDKPMAYILGNEGHGINKKILSLVDDSVSIPINPNCESLNVAIAAGIILAFGNHKAGK